MKIYPLPEWVEIHGSITKAAAALGVSKQNLSYSLKNVKGKSYVMVSKEEKKLLREVPLKKGP